MTPDRRVEIRTINCELAATLAATGPGHRWFVAVTCIAADGRTHSVIEALRLARNRKAAQQRNYRLAMIKARKGVGP